MYQEAIHVLHDVFFLLYHQSQYDPMVYLFLCSHQQTSDDLHTLQYDLQI